MKIKVRVKNWWIPWQAREGVDIFSIGANWIAGFPKQLYLCVLNFELRVEISKPHSANSGDEGGRT